MIASVREKYNANFTEQKYKDFLTDLNHSFNYNITFRVAESPIFVDKVFKKKLIKAADQIIDVIVDESIKQKTSKAIPQSLQVPNESDRPLFMVLDFAIVKENESLEPRLIEMQGFPSLYAFQDFLSLKFREHFAIPPGLNSHFMERAEYLNILSRALLNGHEPENVVLLEIDPVKQNTAIDFLITENVFGIPSVHVEDVIKEGRNLYYIKSNKRIPIHRIYNRVIFDELVKRTDLKLSFSLREEADVEWAGHPNWFFRISKYTMPLIKSEFIPECKFLNEFNELPQDLQNYVLKPLFSFSGSGVIFHLNSSDIDAIPDNERKNYILQRKVMYEPVIQAPDGMVKAELRLMFIWEDGKPRPTLATNLVRLSRGEMIGVKYNKDKTWVGGSVAFFEK